MADYVSDPDAPNFKQAFTLLGHLEILYPGGQPIDPVHHQNGKTVYYKPEVNDFFRLVSEEWMIGGYDIEKANECCRDRALLRDATWRDIKGVLTFILVKEHCYDGQQGVAIKLGIIRDLLFKVEELALRCI